MSEYYVVIPKNATTKREKFLPQQFFDQQILTATMFGHEMQKDNYLMFYKHKPPFKAKDFNQHYLVKILIDHDPDVWGLRGMSYEALHGGNIRINFNNEDKDVNAGEEEQILIRVEAQVMPDGHEMRLSDIEAVKHITDKKTKVSKKKIKTSPKTVIKTKPRVKKTKVVPKTVIKTKPSVKKHKILHKATIKAKPSITKHKALPKAAIKTKSSVKKHKTLSKAVIKTKPRAMKHKTLSKAPNKTKWSAKRPKILHKAVSKNKVSKKK